MRGIFQLYTQDIINIDTKEDEEECSLINPDIQGIINLEKEPSLKIPFFGYHSNNSTKLFDKMMKDISNCKFQHFDKIIRPLTQNERDGFDLGCMGDIDELPQYYNLLILIPESLLQNTLNFNCKCFDIEQEYIQELNWKQYLKSNFNLNNYKVIILRDVLKDNPKDLNWSLKTRSIKTKFDEIEENNLNESNQSLLHLSLITHEIKVGNSALDHLEKYFRWDIKNIEESIKESLKLDLLVCLGIAELYFDNWF